MRQKKIVDKARLEEIMREQLDYAHVLGRIACRLADDSSLVQAHHDGCDFRICWSQRFGHLRCIIFVGHTEDALAQIHIHDDGDVRVETWEPLSVTISVSEHVLCLTRFRSAHE
jgi:hypothetical protein